MLSSLLSLLALSASLISAEESIPYKLKTESDSTFLYITPIDDCKYKVSATGYSGAGSKFHWTDTQNINNSTIVATDYGPNALLDVYAVRRPESLGMAQVFVRTNISDEERTFTQQISIADSQLRYGGYEGVPYVFFFCNTEVTDDFVDLPHTLFIRRSDICLPEGCWDTVLDLTSQGLRGNS